MSSLPLFSRSAREIRFQTAEGSLLVFAELVKDDVVLKVLFVFGIKTRPVIASGVNALFDEYLFSEE